MRKLIATLVSFLKLGRDLSLIFLPSSMAKIVARYIFRTKGAYAFFIHPRYENDFYRWMPLFKYLPRLVLNLVAQYWPSIIVSSITGFRDEMGKEIRGILMSHTALPQTMRPVTNNLKGNHLRRVLVKAKHRGEKKALTLANLAEKLGVKMVGLGALNPWVTDYGILLRQKNVSFGVVIGHAATAAIIKEDVVKIEKILSLNNGDILVAIVGAAGSTGRVVSRLLAREKLNLLLIDLEERRKFLSKFARELRENGIRVEVSSEVEHVSFADIVIVLTSAEGVIIKKDHLSPGTVLLDDTHPSNVARDIHERDDVVIIQVLAHIPGLNTHFNFSLPTRESHFTCLAAVIAATATGWEGDFDIGTKINIEQADEILTRMKRVGITPDAFTDFANYPITDEKWEHVRQIRRIKKTSIKFKEESLKEMASFV